MNTPKYVGGAGRSVSPLRGGSSSSSKPKYYSAEEVNKIVRSAFEPKLEFLMRELEDRQQTIAKLNNKLNANDERLLEQGALLDALLKRQKDAPGQTQLLATLNQLLNERFRQQWEALAGRVREVGEAARGRAERGQLEAAVQAELGKIREAVAAFMEGHKRKSNGYWQKIRDALGKLNGKLAASEKDILDLSAKIDNFQAARARDRETTAELQASRHIARNLLQLRRSVENIYQNYQSVLALQKGLKQRLEEQNSEELWTEDYPRTRSDALLPEQVDLEYSKEEEERRAPGVGAGGQGAGGGAGGQGNETQPMISPLRAADRSASELLQLQRTTPISKSSEHSELFSLNTSNSHALQSRLQNSTFLINLSLETRKEMAQGVRERLLELIEAKQAPRPLQVRYDEQINYLKNAEGNYLFDLRGNMFKVPPNELAKLEEEGLVTRVRRRDPSAGKVKLTHC